MLVCVNVGEALISTVHEGTQNRAIAADCDLPRHINQAAQLHNRRRRQTLSAKEWQAQVTFNTLRYL